MSRRAVARDQGRTGAQVRAARAGAAVLGVVVAACAGSVTPCRGEADCGSGSECMVGRCVPRGLDPAAASDERHVVDVGGWFALEGGAGAEAPAGAAGRGGPAPGDATPALGAAAALGGTAPALGGAAPTALYLRFALPEGARGRRLRSAFLMLDGGGGGIGGSGVGGSGTAPSGAAWLAVTVRPLPAWPEPVPTRWVDRPRGALPFTAAELALHAPPWRIDVTAQVRRRWSSGEAATDGEAGEVLLVVAASAGTARIDLSRGEPPMLELFTFR